MPAGQGADNGGRSITLQEDGTPTASISSAYDEGGAVTNIYIMSNPDKVSRLHEARSLE